MLHRHYESELRYFREGGAAFAEAHPDQARMLRLDALEDRDPYVERLLEGVADPRWSASFPRSSR